MRMEFGAFQKNYQGKAPKWKVAAKYTKALWSSFGLSLVPERAPWVRADTLQSRLRLNLDARAGMSAEDRERLELLVENDDFINAFYTDDPARNVREVARTVFGDEFVQGPLADFLPDEFFSRTYTRNDTNLPFTHGPPLFIHPERKFTFGRTYDYLIFQELYDYRYRFEREFGTTRSPGQFRAFSSPVLAEMDLRFANRIMDTNITRVYDLNGVTYVLFGEHHHYAACSPRLPNAISAMKWITDMSLACPNVIFDVMMEQGTVSMLPHTAREVVGGNFGACERYYADRFANQIQAIKRGQTNQQFIAQQPDGALATQNSGPISTSYLYLFNRFPSKHAWKTREPIFQNVRLHNADARHGRYVEMNEQRQGIYKLLRQRGEFPELATMPGLREMMIGFVFPHELLLPTSIGLEDVDFENDTLTVTALPAAADMFVDPIRGEAVTFEELLHRAGSRVIDPVRRVITLERKVTRKLEALERLAPGTPARLKHCFQQAKREFEAGLTSRYAGRRSPAFPPDSPFAFLHDLARMQEQQEEDAHRLLYLEAMFIDFYGMLRALVHSLDGGGTKRVVTFYGGSQHAETWSYVLQGLGARPVFLDGSAPNLIRSSQGLNGEASQISTASNLSELNHAMRDAGVFQPKITAKLADKYLIQSIYTELDTLKSTPVRVDTYQSAWDNFERRVLNYENGYLRRLARAAKVHSSWEVIAAAVQKVMIALEMFIVDLVATGTDERFIEQVRFHTRDMTAHNHADRIEGRPVVESAAFMFQHFSSRIRVGAGAAGAVGATGQGAGAAGAVGATGQGAGAAGEGAHVVDLDEGPGGAGGVKRKATE